MLIPQSDNLQIPSNKVVVQIQISLPKRDMKILTLCNRLGDTLRFFGVSVKIFGL